MASCGVKTSEKVPGVDLANLDTTTLPGEDFYQYATGGWQAAHPLKPEFGRYGSFDVLRENNEIRIRDLFAELEKTTAEKGSNTQKISDLYKLGMDSVRLNAEGMTPVQEDLSAIKLTTQAYGDKTQVSKLLGEIHRSIDNALFSSGVGADFKDSDMNILYVEQAGLGMSNRDYYLEEQSADIREAYKTFIRTMFTLAGAGDPEAAVEAVMDIETRIAEASLSNVELRDPNNSYNMMTLEDVKKEYPALDWDVYFDAVNVEGIETLSLSHPKAMKVVNDVLTEGGEKLGYYLAFNVLNSAAGVLSDESQQANFEFFGRTMSGQEQMRPRWKRALGVPNSTLGEAVGEMYVAKYFPASSKERMVKMIEDLRTALSQHIDALEWMSTETKAKAQEKLASFKAKIGYPDKWKDYSTLEIDPALSYWANIKRARAWYSDENMAEAGKPVDKTRWGMSPQTVNAYYSPTQGEICFPAAILQPPFFNADADDAVNYGAIGVVIGHEMTHGFDDMGRQFDKDGNLNDWWTAEDAKKFNELADILVAQYDAIQIQPGLMADGRFTLGENIADQGGLRVAYTAWKNSLNGTEPAPIDGFTGEQRFYLAYAGLWAQNIRPEEEARLTKIDEHSLGMWRTNGAVRNLDTFFNAFGITEGKMWLAPEDRVVIW